MVKLILSDLKYALLSRIAAGFFIIFSCFTLLTFYMCYQNSKMVNFDYTKQYEIYTENGVDLEEAIAEGYEMTENTGGKEVVKNPIAYDKEMLGKCLYSLSPRYVIPQFCEQALMFFPIIAALMGVIWSAVDLKNKTIRNRSCRNGKLKSMWCRQISGFFLLVVIMILVLIIAFVIQSIFRRQFLADFKWDISDFPYSPVHSSYLLQFLFAVASVLFYYETGFTAGNLFKGNPIIMIIICVYTLFIPPFFRYDIANIFNNIGVRVSDFIGGLQITEIKGCNIISGFLILSAELLFMMMLNIIVTKKRSAYI